MTGISSRVAAAIAMASSVAAAGCATNFRMSSVGPQEAAIAGRLTIIYNGKIFTDQCGAMFSGRVIRPGADGIVLLPVQIGWNTLEQLECHDGSRQHIQIRGAHFFARGGGTVTEFGDITLTWNTRGGYKATDGLGAIGIIMDGFDDGAVSVSVRPAPAAVREAFQRQTGSEGRWVENLISQPRNRDERPPGSPRDPDQRSRRASGFFCTSSPPDLPDASFCERSQTGCERVRTALARRGLGACAASETAWCLVTGVALHCHATRRACEIARERLDRADACGEQY
jgi:hypothetical protein